MDGKKSYETYKKV
jgi:NIMA (never in mitosis gene a)-related kinase 1/4/5